jgi:hypothetical protein
VIYIGSAQARNLGISPKAIMRGETVTHAFPTVKETAGLYDDFCSHALTGQPWSQVTAGLWN